MIGIKLLSVVAILGASLYGSEASEYAFLVQFNNAFGNYSAETEPVLQNLRQWNSGLVEDFNRELLLQLGKFVPTMRAGDATILEEIMAAINLSEECTRDVLLLRQLYLMFQNWDIQDCASSAWYSLNLDTTERFWPYHNSFAKENSRAIYQAIQTLGRRPIYDVEGLEYELQDQLDYYRNLRVGQIEMLWEEMAVHTDVAYKVSQELDDCREWAEYMQRLDHENIRSYLNSNCFYEEETTLATESTNKRSNDPRQ